MHVSSAFVAKHLNLKQTEIAEITEITKTTFVTLKNRNSTWPGVQKKKIFLDHCEESAHLKATRYAHIFICNDL